MKNLIKALKQKNQEVLISRVQIAVTATDEILHPYEPIKDPVILNEIPNVCPVFDSVLKGIHGSLQLSSGGDPLIISDKPEALLKFAEKNEFKVVALDHYPGLKTRRAQEPPRVYAISKSGTPLLVEISKNRKQATVSFYKKDAPQIKAFKDMLKKLGYEMKQHWES